jgi:hypothetical protein
LYGFLAEFLLNLQVEKYRLYIGKRTEINKQFKQFYFVWFILFNSRS